MVSFGEKVETLQVLLTFGALEASVNINLSIRYVRSSDVALCDV